MISLEDRVFRRYDDIFFWKIRRSFNIFVTRSFFIKSVYFSTVAEQSVWFSRLLVYAILRINAQLLLLATVRYFLLYRRQSARFLVFVIIICIVFRFILFVIISSFATWYVCMLYYWYYYRRMACSLLWLTPYSGPAWGAPPQPPFLHHTASSSWVRDIRQHTYRM